jgi:4-diphosphocytidyl-2-C-methyl-D-erythritol kinase
MAERAAVAWPAPAKLNLFLHVTGRRADGYHELQTLFQILDWGDEVRIRPDRSGRLRRIGADYGVPEDDDLALRAARLLQSETGAAGGAELEVVKRVPIGSGLGGGSSDAATVLVVLNRAWGCGLDADQLAELGARLGADVPVFVRGASALGSGIGERLEPVRLGERHYVLVFPGFPIATAEVFGDPALRRDAPVLPARECLAAMGSNDCEAVVRRRYPEMDRALRALTPWGRPAMTGTGSGIFIPMPSRAVAIRSAREIKNLYNSRAVRGVDRSPLHRQLDAEGT